MYFKNIHVGAFHIFIATDITIIHGNATVQGSRCIALLNTKASILRHAPPHVRTPASVANEQSFREILDRLRHPFPHVIEHASVIPATR